METTQTARTLVETLDRAAESDARRGITVVGRDGSREFRAYSQIRESARRAAAAFQLREIDPHQRVLLAQPTGFEFLTSWFGAMTAGVVPVPFPVPDRQEGESGFRRALREAGKRLEAAGVVMGVDVGYWERPRRHAFGPFSMVTDLSSLFEQVPANITIRRPHALPETAYIQMTEGTTGRPRPVELTHANILANVEAIGEALQVDDSDVGVSWIPLHNPLGLVGVVCFGLYYNLDLVLIDPERFLKHPGCWLKAISRHGGTLSAAPNFAYHYAVRRCRESQLSGLDLSSWRVAMTGGEPVRGQHLDAFLRRFRDYGLDEDLFTPVYGLSEATIGVTFGELDGSFEMDAINRRTLEREGRAEPLPDDGAREAAERMHLVSVGEPLPGIEIEVVDEDGEPVGDRRLGEVATRGPHVMRGYVGEVDERGAARREDGWLYTGDLGYLSEGQLHIVGRACDRIQVSDDRVVFPEEVEFFVDAVDGIYAGRTAVFGMESDDGECEQLVVAFELQSGTVLEDVVEPLGQLLDEHLDLEPDEVVGLSPRSIPRTKSGKVRRFLARKLYEVDRLDRADRTGGLDAVRQLVGRVRREAGSLTERLKSFITGG